MFRAGRPPRGRERTEMLKVKKAVLGAVLLAGTALALAAPAKAQVVQFEGQVGTDPGYGTDPYGQTYQDPPYDPNYQYQDPGYDPNYDPNYSQQYGPSYDQQYYGDQYAYDYGYDWYGDDYGYRYDYTDPFYFTVSFYNPLYDPFYDPYCDYYTPPWGFPPDYCRYQLWNQPVYFGGSWYSGPI